MVEGESNCYYPGCKKNADCNCEMCLASINATLDLLPSSSQRSSITKISVTRTKKGTNPAPLPPSDPSSPNPSSRDEISSPDLKSTARSSLNDLKKSSEVTIVEGKKLTEYFFLGKSIRKLILFFIGFLAVEASFSCAMRWVMTPVFSIDAIKGVGEMTTNFDNLNRKIEFLQSGLKELLVFTETITNCSATGLNWKIIQDGALVQFRCSLYKSRTEEISIWGWPLQAEGLLKTGYDSRLFFVLSGKMTEWSEGRIGYSVHGSNSWWAHKKWSASGVQLDSGTWILEYKRSWVFEKPKMVMQSIVELMQHRAFAVGNAIHVGFVGRVLSREQTHFPT